MAYQSSNITEMDQSITRIQANVGNVEQLSSISEDGTLSTAIMNNNILTKQGRRISKSDYENLEDKSGIWLVEEESGTNIPSKLNFENLAIISSNVGDITKISNIGDGTISGAISHLNSNIITQDSVTSIISESKSYTDTKLAELVGTAPETLDTISELASALSDNADTVTLLTESIGKKADKTDIKVYTPGTGIVISDNDVISTTAVTNIITGDTNGTINVVVGDTSKEVSIKGLGSAAYTSSSDYAKAEHGTHVSFSTNTPKVAGIPSTGVSQNISREDHVHPAQTDVEGNAGTSTKWKSAIGVNGILVQGDQDVHNFGICETDSEDGAKVVSIDNFKLYDGAEIVVKFVNGNSVENPTLNINGDGDKPILYRGLPLGDNSSHIGLDHIYVFRYIQSAYELVGDLNVNTWRGIVDNLESTSTTESLSANQGKVLNEKFGEYLPLTGGKVTGYTSFGSSIFVSKYIHCGDGMGGTVGTSSLKVGNGLASGNYSSSLGEYTIATGAGSHAEGRSTTSSGNNSHAEGYYTSASGNNSHAEGYYTSASDLNTHAEGHKTYAAGADSHAEGKFTIASGERSHAEGYYTSAVGHCSHTEGHTTYAYDEDAHAEGYKTSAIGVYSHAEGGSTCASKKASHAEGESTVASGMYSHTEGYYTSASGSSSHAEGHTTLASGSSSHAEGSATVASAMYSHAEGYRTSACVIGSHAEGYYTAAISAYTHAQGYWTSASNLASMAIGHYNTTMTTGGSQSNTTGTAFAIGNGTSETALSNAFSVDFNGVVKAKSTITSSTTADYAEFFEWEDGNPNSEDRVGKFVTLVGNKITIATSNDDYILGVISGEPFVLGNGDCDTWNHMYLKDEFNRTILEPAPKMEFDEETLEFKEALDEDGNQLFEGTRPVLNPNYDPTLQYVSRFDRPEWAPVGMLGVLSIIHDGTCVVNGYCCPNSEGIATACDRTTPNSYRVIESVTDNVIRAIIK